MNLLRGQLLIDKKEESLSMDEVLHGVKYVVFYFTASWCPPCQVFLPLVKKMHETARARDINLEIIFVPADHDNDEMMEYFVKNHGPWYALPVGPAADAIRKKFHIFSIPALIVLTSQDELITIDGRKDVEDSEDPLSLWFPRQDEDKLSKYEEHETSSNSSQQQTLSSDSSITMQLLTLSDTIKDSP